MDEEKRKDACTNAKKAFGDICDDYDCKFAERIGNIDAEPERERIFILEEIMGEAMSASNTAWLEYNRGLIQAIDEKELIRRKKANMQERV